MGLEIMTLLAIITFLQLTTTLIPESSQGVPKIAIYLTSVMLISSISVITNVIILKFHFSNVQIAEIHPLVNL
jgi:hypothetical protein